MIDPFTSGAPGVFFAPTATLRTLTAVRMDVCAFVGVAPRGPARVPVLDEKWTADLPWFDPARPRHLAVPVAVESFDEYRRRFGGFEGPGLLPYAVRAFFAQGGQRAWIVRIVHPYGTAEDEGGVAGGTVPGIRRAIGGAVGLRARDEGTWGNRLQSSCGFTFRPLVPDVAPLLTGLILPPEAVLPVGTLLRLSLGGGVRVYRFVADSRVEGRSDHPRSERRIAFDAPVPVVPERIETVEAALTLMDGERSERFENLGLSPFHPRWMARVIGLESELAWPEADWESRDLLPESVAPAREELSAPFTGGLDRWPAIEPEDFFDPLWVLGDEPGRGVHALTGIDELSLLVVPDLYSPGPLAPVEPIVSPASLAGPEFAPCVELPPPPVQAEPVPDLDGLRLDPTLPGDLARITGLQERLVELAEQQRSWIVLLDVPPRLHQRQILAWRARLRSAFAAAYFPWLLEAPADDGRDALIRVNPAAVAAGIVASRELRYGVAYGPANQIAREVVAVDEAISPQRHDELHPAGINVYLREPAGIRLAGARTLSADPAWRQLSVRRLITLLARTLDREMQWAVFEPNGKALRTEVKRLLTGLLRRLFQANAFAGANESEAFFIRFADDPQQYDLGRFIVEVGVAPAEPLEFLVVRLVRDTDGNLTVEG